MPRRAHHSIRWPLGMWKNDVLADDQPDGETHRWKIWLGDNDVSHWDETQLRLNMGYVIQSGGLFPHRTIVDNIATVPVLLGEKRKNARKAALQLMKRVGLEPHLGSRYPYQLSGGQQQRVGVA